MAYIGKGLVGVLSENKAIDTMSNPNGVVTTMTLSRTPGSVNNVEVYIDGVFQTPGDEYTLEGDVLTFTTAPATNAVVVAVVGNDSTIANVENKSITGVMIPDGSVTDSKISGINSTKISGTLPALDGSSLTNLNISNLEGTLPALDGSLLTGLSSFTKNASDPATNTNGTLGDVWVNTTSGEMYVLTDATTDDNFWTNVGSGTGNVQSQLQFMSATGGAITTDGNYKVHTFTSSGTFTPVVGFDAVGNKVEYLVIAGGGGAGHPTTGHSTGGGGAGGYLTDSAYTVTDQGYTVTVGAGGVAADGSDSIFSTITSTSGGVGSYGGAGGDPGNGGSGGGGAGSEVGGTGTAGQGNNGGNGDYAGGYGGGGGGGSSTAGANPPGQVGGAGGNGTASDILVTGTDVIRAGGGGAGGYTGAGAAGSGGAGAGSSGGSPGADAQVNTGSGGGGSKWTATGAGSGGSGIVILRYRFQ